MSDSTDAGEDQGEALGQARVSPGFKFNRAGASASAASGFSSDAVR